jgi:hypothetical protein
MCRALEPPVHASKLRAELHRRHKVVHEVTPLHLQEEQQRENGMRERKDETWDTGRKTKKDRGGGRDLHQGSLSSLLFSIPHPLCTHPTPSQTQPLHTHLPLQPFA